MEQFIGQCIFPGVASGPVHVLLPTPVGAAPSTADAPSVELARFRSACGEAARSFARLEQTALEQVGPEGADIFHIQAMLLEDPDLLETAEALIAAGQPAAQAVRQTARRFSAAFESMEDPYLRARGADILAVSQQLLRLLSGPHPDEPPTDGRPVLLAADALTPGDLLRRGRDRLLGLILSHCSPLGHTAILARTMGLPTLTGVEPRPDWQGRCARLDSGAGQLILDPPPDLPAPAPSRFPDVGERSGTFPLFANIGSPDEAAFALRQGAKGVGLFRSEFLFLGRPDLPGEEEQFSAYRDTVLAMEGRPVVIRTLDAGADKPVPALSLPPEDNPALGLRGIRLSLARPELLRVQLRAILRASAFGPLSVMFPMVSRVEEVTSARAILDQCRRALADAGVSVGPLPVGVMIETPAAALLADRLAQEADFFSIGTNDLTQYTLAADRQSTDPALCDPRHPAVLALIRMTVEQAHRRGCPVSVCGELAADLTMTEALLAMGVDELSVSPALLPALDRQLQTLTPAAI